MKVIDLLNLIASEEIKDVPDFDNLPTRIKHKGYEYSLLATYENGRNYLVYTEDNLPEDVWGELEISSYNLNDEVEIIDYLEENK